MSRSAKVEELGKLFEAGALTQEEYQDALRRVDAEHAEAEAAQAQEEPATQDIRPPDQEQAPPPKKTKPYQTKRMGEWSYQDRHFPELEEEDPLDPWRHYIKIGSIALGVAILLFLGPSLCAA